MGAGRGAAGGRAARFSGHVGGRWPYGARGRRSTAAGLAGGGPDGLQARVVGSGQMLALPTAFHLRDQVGVRKQ
jgi:hypothetical protein